MDLLEVTYASDRYGETLVLRKRVLRDPLGLDWTAEERKAERRDRHFAALDEEAVVACVVVVELGGGRIKFRQMAVAPERQRTGTGGWLLEGVEAILRREGATGFELHARDAARGFYEKLGYVAAGEPFTEVGIAHWRMEKVQA